MNDNAGTVIYDAKFDTQTLRREFGQADREADRETKKLGQTIDRNISEATDRTSERFESFRMVAVGALKATGVALGVAGAASVKMAGDFEQSLNVLKSVTGATANQMSELSAKARELGQDAALPGISAADAAGAMTELAKAGLSVNDVLAASKGVLSLAKAGNIEVAQAALVASQALNAFKLEGKEAARVADILSAGSNASAASVEGMALGLQQSAAVASQFGIKLEDAVTALALFANRGIQGSDAGTSLKTMLIALAKPSGEAAELMKKLGINAFDAKGQFVGLRGLALELQSGLKGLSQEQQNAALATIFGTDAFRAAAFLADSAGKAYDDMSKQVNKVGAATDLAAAQNSGFNGALDNLKSTLETLGTEIGSKVLPPLTEFVKTLAEELPPKIEWMIDHGDELIGVLGGIAVALGTVRFAGFVNDLTLANKSLDAFIGAKNASGIRGIAALFGLSSKNAASTTKEVVGLSKAVLPAAASFGLAGVAIGGLALGAGLLIKNFIDGKKAALDFGDSAKKGAASLTPFSDNISEVADTTSVVATNLKETAKSIDLVTLATKQQERAKNDQVIAETKYKRIQEQTKGINEQYVAAQKGLTEAQTAYNAAVSQFGPQSNEAQLASGALQVAQVDLELALRNSFGQTVNLQVAQGSLKQATDELTLSTNNLKNIQNFYSEAIAGTTGRLYEMKGAVKLVGDEVAVLSSNIGRTIEISGNLGQLKQNFIEVGDVIQAANRSLEGLQKTQKDVQLQQSNLRLQNFAPTKRRASGGPVSANESYLVGEVGMEMFVPKTSGTIIPNDILSGFASATMQSLRGAAGTPASRSGNGAGGVQIINHNNITTGVTVDQVARAQARELRRLS